MAADSSASFLSSEAGESDYIAIGTVGKPVGLAGWCRLFPYGKTLGKIPVPFSCKAGFDKPRISLELVALKKDAKGYTGQFNTYAKREEVDTLKNYILFINRDRLPVNQSDEYFHFELKGLKVYLSSSKKCIGTVIDVHNYPTTDALEVKKKSGGTIIIPMTKEVIPEIDSKNGTIFVDDSVIDELF